MQNSRGTNSGNSHTGAATRGAYVPRSERDSFNQLAVALFSLHRDFVLEDFASMVLAVRDYRGTAQQRFQYAERVLTVLFEMCRRMSTVWDLARSVMHPGALVEIDSEESYALVRMPISQRTGGDDVPTIDLDDWDPNSLDG